MCGPTLRPGQARYLLLQNCEVFGKGQVLPGGVFTYRKARPRF